MDRERALMELSTGHAVALRLRDAGAGEDQIAVALGIAVEGVSSLLEVAEAKLAAILSDGVRPDHVIGAPWPGHG